MSSQSPTAVKPRGNKRVLVVVLLGIVALLNVAALGGGLLYVKLAGQNTAGLEGTWRDPNNPKFRYEFNRNGEVDAWNGPQEWFNRLGWVATWKRNGQQISIKTDRNWDFQGQLEGNTIRGKMLMHDQSGASQSEIDLVWQRE